MSVGVIVVAAGRGERLGGAVPKQLLDLGGRTILQRSVEAFDRVPETAGLVVVLPPDVVDDGPVLVGPTSRPCRFVAGGKRRQDSVRLGFQALAPDCSIVLIHDAARPFVTSDVIERVIEAARRTGAAVPATEARDTVKRVAGAAERGSRGERGPMTVRVTIPRHEVWLAQTPQGFRRDLLDAVLAHPAAEEATDEAMLAERAGYPVEIVPGDEGNVKVTTARDLDAARARLSVAPRVGTGYDLHQLVAGRPLVLAGVQVPFDRGPLGHSDGDVVSHALADAMFGAAGLGDIGQHFPNTEPRWKDVPGLDLLRETVAIIGRSGWRLSSADVTVVLERPKLLPHVTSIRHALAAALGLDLTSLSVKPKTNEGVDAVGRGEAIAAHAAVVLVQGHAS